MRKLLMLLFSLSLLSCAEERKDSKDLTAFLPADAAVIVKLQNPDLFFSHLSNNGFLQANNSYPLFGDLRKKLSFLKHFEHKEPAFLSFSNNVSGPSFTFIQKGLPSIELDSVKNKSVETLTAEYGVLKKYTLEGQITYATSIDSILILSDSHKNLENLLSNNGKSELSNHGDFMTALKASAQDKPVVLINHANLDGLMERLLPSATIEPHTFSNWTTLDIDLSPSAINLNGITLASDTLPKTINLFKGVSPAANELARVVPISSQGLFSFTFEEFTPLRQNLSAAGEETEERQLLENATEAGVVVFNDASVFAVRALNIEIPTSAFKPQRTAAEEFHGIPIYHYDGEGFGFLAPLVEPEEIQYFLFLDHFVLFAKELSPLQEIVTAFQNENTLAKSTAYQNTFQSLSTEASLLWMSNHINFREKLKDLVAEELVAPTEALNFENYPMAAIQFIYQNDFAHVNAILAKSEAKVTENRVSQIASITLDAPLLAPPVFFSNHRTDGLDIAVQDIENTLYLISPSGTIHWKKKLDSPILGKIQQVDLYKNGRYQLAFATENSVQVIDRDGNRVKPFPLEFRDDITQPLAIFDYDNNRKYRFLVVQNNNIYMYDSRAKGVGGFDFRRTSSEIISPPKHIRLGKKDYILIQEASGKINILSRTGKHRVEVKEKIEPSGNEWYEYNNSFASTNAEGALIKIDERGRITSETTHLAENHAITATPKTLVSLSDNLLTIKGKTVELDFGLYTEPQLFYLNNKIYVSVTDTQAHKVYLFDSNAELLPDFPIYGNSSIDLGNAALELVVMGDENSVLVYEL